MSHINRPPKIAIILETIDSEKDTAIRTELERYIANLEARQPDRPDRIAAILKSIGTAYSAELEGALETYIAGLEAVQQPLQSEIDHHDLWDPENPPVWSQQRFMERERQRRERAVKKQNDYR